MRVQHRYHARLVRLHFAGRTAHAAAMTFRNRKFVFLTLAAVAGVVIAVYGHPVQSAAASAMVTALCAAASPPTRGGSPPG